MPLVQLPTPCALRDVYVALGWDPTTTIGQIAGSTKPPTNFVVPACQFVERRTAAASRQALYGKVGVLQPGQRPGRLSAEQHVPQLIVTRRANEGNNTSIYVAKGVYETNYTFDQAGYIAAKKDPDIAHAIGNAANWLARWKNASQPRVYFVMPSTIAEMNRQAEAEHCNDFILAYQLTLGALEVALNQVAATPFGPFASAQLARAAVIDQLRNTLPMGLRDVAQNLDLCGQKYLALCQKSKIRDSKNYHNWGLDYLGPAVQAQSIHYLTGRQRAESGRIFLQYTQGEAEVGRHSSVSIIQF